MRKSYRGTLAAWFLLTIALLFAIGVMVYRSISGFIEQTRWVTHTHHVLGTLSDTLINLINADRSQKGYLITGKAPYLQDYYAACPRVRDDLRLLRDLTADNPDQQNQIKRLERRIDERILTLERIIGEREKSFDAAQRAVLGGVGKRQMEEALFLADEIAAQETRLLNQRNSAAEASSRETLASATGGIAICCLVLLTMLNVIAREAKRRAAAEASLQTANAELQDSLANVLHLTQEKALLSEMGDMLQSCHSTAEAYSVVERSMAQLMPELGGALCVINSSQNLVEVVASWGAAAMAGAGTQRLFSPAECWGLRRGRPHVVHDTAVQQVCPHLAADPPGSTMCVPMVALGETLGLLFVDREPAESWTEASEQLARDAAEQISLSLANLKLQETLRIQSIRDPLSGLFNRRYLEASLDRELSRAKRAGHPVGVIMMDIDHFKRFNDTFGHEAGDILLTEFGALLQRCCRDEDIACRYGGEEFTLLLPGADLETTRQRAEQLRAQTRALHIEYRRQPVGTITLSLGIAAFPLHGEEGDEVMRVADGALYRAKREGRDRVVVAESV